MWLMILPTINIKSYHPCIGCPDNLILQAFCGASSLRRKRNLTSVSNFCETVPRSLFWVPNGLNSLIHESVLQISFHPDWQIDDDI